MSVPGVPKITILDLPLELLFSICSYLDVPSFLSLTFTCRDLNKPEIASDSAFWSSVVRHDFRVPNRPVVQQDGKHWQQLYKRLRTQSKVFTWGNNEQGCLGHSYESPAQLTAYGRPGRRINLRRSKHVRSPGAMDRVAELGVISDLQCGGWSTTMLTRRGALYSVGVLNNEQVVARDHSNRQRLSTTPTPLSYPPGLPRPQDRHDPATAIKQFSAGRAHILGLSDSGRIWSWNDLGKPAVNVKFVHHNTKEDGSERGAGAVKKVVAGWNKSAALIEGSGIVLWEPLELDPDETDVSDAVLVLESEVVPRTSHSNGSKGAESVGDVQNFILLEACLLFNTSLGKAFACKITWDDDTRVIGQPLELNIPKARDDNTQDAHFVTDVQGSFRSFAIFTRSGAVLTSDQDRLMPLLTSWSSKQHIFQRIPALQNSQVISLAFGDYHFHALHAPGYITSYGREPQTCGALGLGGQGAPEGRLRGIRNQGGDGWLVPHAYTTGRRIWFGKEKGEWITFMTSGGVDYQEAAERIRMAIGSPGINAQGEVSEWIEQEGRDWEEKFNIRQDCEDDGLGAYFALSVSAAGWHSGALVLVNEQMAQRLKDAVEIPDLPAEDTSLQNNHDDDEPTLGSPDNTEPDSETTTLWDRAADWGRYFLGIAPYNSEAAYDPNSANTGSAIQGTAQHQNPRPISYGAAPREGYRYIWAEDHFPRLTLSDGTEMPGEIPFDEWRYGRPDWKLDWDAVETEDNELDA